MCPVMLAHMAFAYELCTAGDHPGKVILDWLIPIKKGGLGNARCTMLVRRNGVNDKQLKDWAKYKAAMAEMDAARHPTPEGRTTDGEAHGFL